MWLIDAFFLCRDGLPPLGAALPGRCRPGLPGPGEGPAGARPFLACSATPLLRKKAPGTAAPRLRTLGLRLLTAWQGLAAGLRAWPASRLLSVCLVMSGCVAGCSSRPSTAFFYGAGVPVAALAQFDRVVVEAENLKDLDGLRTDGADVFAYVSVGEAEGWRASAKALPAELFLGTNTAWSSRIADLTQPGWRDYLIGQRMAPLWQAGYRGFFLDTLDSYQRVVTNAQEEQAQARALVEIVRTIKQRFPGVKLLFNRGFAVLPEVGPLAVGLVAESLFQSWDPATRQYLPVTPKERTWLLERLNDARHRYDLPITVIDYVPADQPQLAQATARQISALGFTPWVSTPGLDMLGVGAEK